MWQTIDVWINNSKPSMSLHVCIQLYTLIPYIPIVTAFTIDQIMENGKMLWNCNSVILCVWNWIASKRTRYTGNYSFSYNEVNENELVGCKCNEYALNILFSFLSILLISPGFFFHVRSQRSLTKSQICLDFSEFIQYFWISHEINENIEWYCLQFQQCQAIIIIIIKVIEYFIDTFVVKSAKMLFCLSLMTAKPIRNLF